jgi:hypothetical protein
MSVEQDERDLRIAEDLGRRFHRLSRISENLDTDLGIFRISFSALCAPLRTLRLRSLDTDLEIFHGFSLLSLRPLRFKALFSALCASWRSLRLKLFVISLSKFFVEDEIQ